MFREIFNIASECIRRPRTHSHWSPRRGRYVCEMSEEGRALAQDSGQSQYQRSPINPTFKFVFRWSFAGTLFFIALCVVCSLAAGREPPPLFEKIVMSTFSLAEIGFGAIVGLLGAKHVDGSMSPTVKSDEASRG